MFALRMSTRSKLATLCRQVDTLETQCNLMSTGSKVGTFVDRFETCYLCRQVDTLETCYLCWQVDKLAYLCRQVNTLETCVPLSTGRHARNVIPYVDMFQPYVCRQVDTLNKWKLLLLATLKQHDSAMHHSCSWLPGPAVDLLYYTISIKSEYIQNFSVAY